MSLEAIFDRHAESDGQLTLAGYTRLVNETQPAGVEPISESKLAARFAALDADLSGRIDKKEFVSFSLLEALTRERGRLLDLLDSWDSDRNRKVDPPEFRVAISKLGYHAGEEYVDALFSALDEDGNGTIEFKELATALRPSTVARNRTALKSAIMLAQARARARAQALRVGARVLRS